MPQSKILIVRRKMKRFFKYFGSIIGLYILFRVLMAYFLPQSGGAMIIIANVLFAVVVILGVYTLFLGGINASPIKKMWRIISLIIGLSIVSVIIISLLGNDAGFGDKFIENVVPFGKIIATLLEMNLKLISAGDVSFIWSSWGMITYLVENIFKLMLATILYPIITDFFLMSFIKENDSENHLFGARIRRIITSFFGAVLTGFCCMFVVSLMGSWLKTTYHQTGEVINFIFQLVFLAGLIAVFILTPIIRTKITIIGSLIKMLTINFAIVFVVIMSQYKSKYPKILVVIFLCIAISIMCDVLFKKRRNANQH